MTERPGHGTDYRTSGVDTAGAQTALGRLAASIRQTLGFRDGRGTGRPVRGLGYYANVLDLGGNLGLAVTCDGVGTKLLVAEALNRYDTIGIDCIAMNVNDLICVGAEPIAMLDYLGVGKLDLEVFDQVGRGLLEGCRRAGITIPGGEIAQIREMVRGEGPTLGLDIVGTAVGVVPLDRVLFGDRVRPGDIVVGLASTGLHSNGYTLARRVLAPRREDYHRFEAALGRTVGEEMLEPTALYVAFANALFASETEIHAVCHITGDGYMNLVRVEAPVGFRLDAFPPPPPVFQLIEERGRIPKHEMYEVFNMGVGLCLIGPSGSVARYRELAREHGFESWVIGCVTGEAGVVRIPQHGIVGREGRLRPE
jgi:phosphoribosylformylglycinamidine cyclo-ligase